MKIIRNR